MKFTKIQINIGITIALLAFLVVLYFTYKNRDPSGDTIFLCTTYFDCPKRNSWEMFQKGINGLLGAHSQTCLSRIDRWIVVNEYSPKPKDNWQNKMSQTYPFIEFIQKTQQDQGQAKSLNHLMSYLPPYTYWLHWEESWYPTRPFLDDAWSAMDVSDVSQLQFTKNETGDTDWMNFPRTCDHSTAICRIHHTPVLDQAIQQYKTSPNTPTEQEVAQTWPLYSLRPSLNRVSFYTFGNFTLDPQPYPLTSEYDFAARWYTAGGKKAVFSDGPVTRPPDYVSTHD